MTYAGLVAFYREQSFYREKNYPKSMEGYFWQV